MKVKLRKDIIKEYGFGVGGDMSESVAIAVDSQGNPIKYKDLNSHEGTIFTTVFDCRDSGREFLVVDHESPISKQNYDIFNKLYEE